MHIDLDYNERPFFRSALWEATWRNHEASDFAFLAAEVARARSADTYIHITYTYIYKYTYTVTSYYYLPLYIYVNMHIANWK